MAQLTLFSVAILLVSNAVADILVQPGYNQPQSSLHPIVQPPWTYSRASGSDDQQQQGFFDPGYHLELHPVYPGMQVPADQTVSYSLVQPHQLSPYLPRSAQKRLNSGKLGDLGVVRLPLGLPSALSSPYVPLAVQSRRRRASGDESTAGLGSAKPNEATVATKSSLNQNVPPVVDLQSLNGEATENLNNKRVEVRQSPPTHNGLLLGLNPANMYNAYPQYRSVDMNTLNPTTYQQFVKHATPQTSQISSRTTQEQTPTQQQTTPTRTMEPRVNLLKMQGASPLHQPASQLRQQSGMLQNSDEHERRNIPDPRPIAANPMPMVKEAINGQSETQSADGKQMETGAGDDLLGGKHKIKFHVHKHGTFTMPRSASSESSSCTCSNPGYIVYDGSSSNIALPETSSSALQVYPVPSVQGTTYSNANYALVPQSYSNYVSNGLNYLQSPCPQNLYNAPQIMYRLV